MGRSTSGGKACSGVLIDVGHGLDSDREVQRRKVSRHDRARDPEASPQKSDGCFAVGQPVGPTLEDAALPSALPLEKVRNARPQL